MTPAGGGFPPPGPEPPECAGDACQSVPAAPATQTPASSLFHGPGNVHEGAKKKKKCAKGNVRRKGRCVKKHRAKKHHKRHRHHKRHAKPGRGH